MRLLPLALLTVVACGLSACSGGPASRYSDRQIDRALLSAPYAAQPSLVVAREIDPADERLQPIPVDSAGIPNDHLQYAITWFSLAAVWIAMTLTWIRKQAQGKD